MSPSPLAMVQDCGAVGYFIVMLGGLGLTIAIGGTVVIALGKDARRPLIVALVALAIGMTALGGGAAGAVLGRSRTDAAVGGGQIDPEMVEAIRRQGYSEAGQCVAVGGASSAIPLLASVAALAVWLQRKGPPPQ